MRLMQLIGLRRILPKALRRGLREEWNHILAWERYYHERHFYRQFIQPGDLVFDVGANIGGKTAAFLSLGARVVAVEPNPVCAHRLREANRNAISKGKLCLETVAVASKLGEIKI